MQTTGWSALDALGARWLAAPPARPRAYLMAALYVAVSALIAETIYRLSGTTRLSPVFLAAVLLTAVNYGSRPAFLAAALAFGIYNFYLVEPRFSFTLDTPDEILTLVLFPAVALLTGGLAGRVREEALRSQSRARSLEALFEATRELSSTDGEDALRARLADQLAALVQGEARIEHEGRTWRAGSSADGAWSSRPLLAGPEAVGAACWRAADPAAGEEGDVQAAAGILADVGAAAIARSRLAAENARIESLARTEKLHTALLASVSHDFRTPLTAILTSATSLRTYGDRFEPTVRLDLLATIEEEAERLNGYVANLLSFTRLEAGALEAQTSSVVLADVLKRLLKRYRPRTGGRIIALNGDPGRCCAAADPFLLDQVLANVLENAIRYSPPASTIALSVASDGARALIEVADEGPGVPEADVDRIFEKFFRTGPGARQQGTGLGLSIARGMVEAMGGTITAANRTGGPSGLRVTIGLPAPREP